MTNSQKQKKIITVLVEKNPKRRKTRGYKQFSILARYNGRPIEDFKREEGHHRTLDRQSGWPAAEIRWCRARNFIKLS